MSIKLSILTVCYNSEKFIAENIQSVDKQTYSQIEHVIKDGVSTDNTLSILKSAARSNRIILSNSDKNMYDALNTGLTMVSGDLVWMLNSDDFIADKTVVDRVVRFIRLQKNWDQNIYLGDALIANDKSIKQTTRKSINPSVEELVAFGNCTFVPHPCLIVPKRVIDKIGFFDTEINVASDYDWIIRLVMSFNLINLGFATTVFRRHDKSLTKVKSKLMLKETLEISDRFALKLKIKKHRKNFCYLTGALKYVAKNPSVLTKNYFQ